MQILVWWRDLGVMLEKAIEYIHYVLGYLWACVLRELFMVVKKRVCLYTFLESVIYFNTEKKFNFPCLLEKSKKLRKYTKIRLSLATTTEL